MKQIASSFKYLDWFEIMIAFVCALIPTGMIYTQVKTLDFCWPIVGFMLIVLFLFAVLNIASIRQRT